MTSEVTKQRDTTTGFPFEIGKVYHRQSEIHDRFGGQRQRGISPVREHPFVFVFTGGAGDEHGYHDHWDDDGVFHYYGEGRFGDMKFTDGNAAILNHAEDGNDLLLFENDRPTYVRYLGRFVCASYEFDEENPDTEGNPRRAIIFNLVPAEEHIELDVLEEQLKDRSLDELREQALQSAGVAPKQSASESRRTVYKRSAAVKAYVLARADGVCESCGLDAPFQRKDNTPYLEPHHTRRLSDGGIDHPRWVGAICPNCHREIHYGKDGAAKNDELVEFLGGLEG